MHIRKIIILLISLVGLGACYPNVQQYSKPVKQTISIEGSRGKLAAILQTPAHQKKYPLVMILHGFNGHKKMCLLTELARQLNARGIATIAFDFNGHGQSEGSFLDMTILNELEDARKVYEYVSQLPAVTSVSAAGHSQGGVVTAMLAGQLGKDKIKSIALLAPAAELKDDTAKGLLFGTRFNPKQVPEYITLYTGLKVGKAFLETTQTLPIYETAAHYEGPVLIVHSVLDELVPYRYGEQFSRIYKNVQMETLQEYDHSFTQDIEAVDEIVANFFAKQLLGK